MESEKYAFGSFQLIPQRRLLLDGDRPTALGSRALDILIALVEVAGTTVSNRQIIARVWQGIHVDESALRVHIVALRKVLRDGRDGRRFILNVPGQGYCFTAPVTREQDNPEPGIAKPAAKMLLPRQVADVVGRADSIAAVVAQLGRRRLLTIVGPGGIGKTTVATAVANVVAESFSDGVAFVPLAALTDAAHVSSSIGRAIELAAADPGSLPNICSWLRDKQVLLVLDNCEHVIDKAAEIAEILLKAAPRIHILATSREPLRAEDEALHRLATLSVPLPATSMTATEALTYSSVQLFVERATASFGNFSFTDAMAPIVCEICRRLDGLPLALELAAVQVEVIGLQDLARRLEDRFSILTKGRRTALQRQQTLRATMDWSYDLLPSRERIVLRRLATFRGDFTVEAANAVASGVDVQAAAIIESIANLAAQSLVSTDISSDITSYRLLETTRIYAAEKLEASGEVIASHRKHAAYFLSLFEHAEQERDGISREDWLAAHARWIDNVRSALDWAFSPDGDHELGASLTAAVVPLLIDLSLLTECRERTGRALAALGEDQATASLRMRLSAGLGWSLLYGVGRSPATAAAWGKTLELAEALNDSKYRRHALWGLCIDQFNNGNVRVAVSYAERVAALIGDSNLASDRMTADRLQATALHYLGDQRRARHYIDRALAHGFTVEVGTRSVGAGLDLLISAHYFQARILYLQGFANQARRIVRQNIAECEGSGQTLTFCSVLGQGACPISLLAGDLDDAEQYGRMLLAHTQRFQIRLWNIWAGCFNSLVAIRRGDVEQGVKGMREGLNLAGEARLLPRFMLIRGEYARYMGQAGAANEALQNVAEILAGCEARDEGWYVPELLRIQAGLLLSAGSGQQDQAESLHLRSLAMAREQDARAWELRTGISYARFLIQRQRRAEATTMLQSVLDRFPDASATDDARAAGALLAAPG